MKGTARFDGRLNSVTRVSWQRTVASEQGDASGSFYKAEESDENLDEGATCARSALATVLSDSAATSWHVCTEAAQWTYKSINEYALQYIHKGLDHIYIFFLCFEQPGVLSGPRKRHRPLSTDKTRKGTSSPLQTEDRWSRYSCISRYSSRGLLPSRLSHFYCIFQSFWLCLLLGAIFDLNWTLMNPIVCYFHRPSIFLSIFWNYQLFHWPVIGKSQLDVVIQAFRMIFHISSWFMNIFAIDLEREWERNLNRIRTGLVNWVDTWRWIFQGTYQQTNSYGRVMR